ncbi:unnamed protein product [Cuscuta campestris]|uniref:Uncharacterized protein n=1 Tax=Cuscuta campestris TaxID=132261 RepID=A0A484NJH0_9ASTE|nr:unnamed protein product [Cuscuta campestris]
MEEIIASGTTNLTAEATDSGSSTEQHDRHKRRRLQENPVPASNAAAPASSSRFKGVVAQQSGNWGAQIYANHQRVWLGTFKTEEEAASAYDSAALRLRRGDAHRNFAWTRLTLQEPSFQSQFQTGELLKMIKDGSYAQKFSDHCTRLAAAAAQGGQASLTGLAGSSEPACSVLRQLFKKELTPSDVGKLNRLVIPKKYALKYFPRAAPPPSEKAVGDADGEETELVFYDRSMRSWKFRYCYWKSSQSFVFTRGWNRFVKDKGVKARDTVVFSAYEFNKDENSNGPGARRSICVVDVEYNKDNDINNKDQNKETRREGGVELEKENMAVKAAGFTLFGVQIVS